MCLLLDTQGQNAACKTDGKNQPSGLAELRKVLR